MKERRRDPATGEWVSFATERAERDEGGEGCAFCPDPSGGSEIPLGAFAIAVFDNAFPPLEGDPPAPQTETIDLHATKRSIGASEVIVYTDRHDAGLATVGRQRIGHLVEVWADRYAELGSRPDIAYVLIFENSGPEVGATVDHPHQQIHAFPDIPPRPLRELQVAQQHLERYGTCASCDVVARERADRVRIVAANRYFIAFVPFAARFPYEVRIMTHRHATHILTLSRAERAALADVIVAVMRAYRGVLHDGFQYALAVHQRPTDDAPWDPVSHFRVDFMPPHSDADTIRHLGGGELGGGAFVNEVAPEDAARQLREAAERSAAPADPPRAPMTR